MHPSQPPVSSDSILSNNEGIIVIGSMPWVTLSNIDCLHLNNTLIKRLVLKSNTDRDERRVMAGISWEKAKGMERRHIYLLSRS